MTATDRRADRLVRQLATRAHRAERLLVEAVVLALLVGTLVGLAGGIYVTGRVALQLPCSQEVAP